MTRDGLQQVSTYLDNETMKLLDEITASSAMTKSAYLRMLVVNDLCNLQSRAADSLMALLHYRSR